MSERSFVERLAKARKAAADSLLGVEDGDSHRHASIRGTVRGMDEAMRLFREENKTDDTEGGGE